MRRTLSGSDRRHRTGADVEVGNVVVGPAGPLDFFGVVQALGFDRGRPGPGRPLDLPHLEGGPLFGLNSARHDEPRRSLGRILLAVDADDNSGGTVADHGARDRRNVGR